MRERRTDERALHLAMEQHTIDRTDLLDTAHGVLANRRQRRIVRVLEERGGRASLEGLAARLGEADGTDPDRLAVQLHHAILPRLAGEDVIAWSDGMVSLTRRGRLVATIGRITASEVEASTVGRE